MRVVTNLEYSDFGTPQAIDAPPAADTVPFPEVQDQIREYLANLQATAATPAT